MSEQASHGFVAVDVDHDHLLSQSSLKQTPAVAFSADAFQEPRSQIATKMAAYGRQHLPQETFNHSMRVYCYGLALLPHLQPQEAFKPLAPETWYLACLFHDIGTAPQNLSSTSMSFDLRGGVIAHNVLSAERSDADSPADTTLQYQADGVAEAVIRHQDLGKAGKITALGALLQLATIVDNTGQFAEFVHEQTIEAVVRLWPRLGWSGCFAAIVREEGRLKPWAHTTKMGVEEFAAGIEGNKATNRHE